MGQEKKLFAVGGCFLFDEFRIPSIMKRTQVIGLTGGIASGKSLVASMLKRRKIPVIDADQIAREVVKPGKNAYHQILEVFGPTLLKKDKTINRQRLGEVVFGNEGKRRILEAITHPPILKTITSEIRRLKRGKKRLIVVDAALLFESGLHKKMDKNILVTTNPEIQLKRLMKRDRIDEGRAWSKILSQLPSPKKQRLADYQIDNSGTPRKTEAGLTKILSVLQGPGRGLHVL
jgi:dephospho-CoA kinase